MDPTRRFGGRAADYDRYRPGYPAALARWLAERGFAPGMAVADVGAGTGLFAELLLGLGCRVHLVEPDAAMIALARARLTGRPGASFHAGRAEATGLADASVDCVAAAQAFHWFEAASTRAEFARILRGGRRVLLVWNDRRADSDPVMADFEALLRAFGADYAATTYRRESLTGVVHAFLGGPAERCRFDNAQELDREGLLGRLFSASYMPLPDAPDYPAAQRAASELFARHQRQGLVVLRYDTIAYLGSLPAPGPRA